MFTPMKNTFTSIISILIGVLFLLPGKSQGQASQHAIMFFIHNPQVNGNRYEFDIYAVVSQVGTYHSRGNIYLNYNPQAFGTSVAANSRVQATKLLLLNDTIPNFGPKYSIVNIFDNSSTRFSVAWASNFLSATPGPAAHTEMRTTPTALYHISLEIINPNATLGVSLHQPLMLYEQFYFASRNRERLYAMAPFPVEWQAVSAEYVEGLGTQIQWTTAREHNTATYEVEKQVNRGDFIRIATQKAAGHSDGLITYSYLDPTESGTQTYYRIKQIDQDGIASYSSVVALKLPEVEKLAAGGYPNPVKDLYHLRIQHPESGWIEAHIRNIQGQLVKKERLWVSGNQPNEFQLNLSQLEAGCYFLETVQPLLGEKSKVQRIMKL